jgi:hypothetical protein
MSGPTAPGPTRAKKPAAGKSRRNTAANDEISARSAKHAAWVAAGAAILAAVLAAGGTLWSGHESAKASDRAAQTAADAAVKAVSIQLSGETEKSRAEFLRSQQKVLYTKVITDLQKLDGARGQYAAMVFNPTEKPENLGMWKKRYDGPYATFMDDQNSVLILASEPAQQAFVRLMKAHKLIHNNYLFYANLKSASWPSFTEPPSLQDTIQRAVRDSQVAEDDFVKAAKHDMGL